MDLADWAFNMGIQCSPTSPAPTDTFLFRTCPWFGSFSFFFCFNNCAYSALAYKADVVNTRAVVCNIPHLELRGAEFDRSGSRSS